MKKEVFHWLPKIRKSISSKGKEELIKQQDSLIGDMMLNELKNQKIL